MSDGVNPIYYPVYQNAFSADILQRVGPSCEAVLQDLDYIFGKLSSMSIDEFSKTFREDNEMIAENNKGDVRDSEVLKSGKIPKFFHRKKILEIKKAIYFDPQIGPANGTDVTLEITSEVRNNRLFYNGSYNLIFPDHFKRKRKKLRIELEYRGKKHTKQYDEDEKIDLPYDLGLTDKRWWEKNWVQLIMFIGAIASIIALYLYFR